MNDVNSEIATLIYISVILYGTNTYNIADKVAILLFFVTLATNLYIAMPESIVITNINIFRQFTNEKLNILNIKGAYAVRGL